jgi:septum formation protein
LTQLILASQSPRRQQFLRDLGLEFTVMVADIDETPRVGEAPIDLVRRLAEEKARAIAAGMNPDQPTLIIAADTVVALGDRLLGKPRDADDAVATLALLRGKKHNVHSGVSVLDIDSGRQLTRINSTQVRIRAYSDAEIAAYVAGGDPMDKAGAYAIQHKQFAPVAQMDGCFASVMGLPLADLRDLLAAFGVTVPRALPPICEQHSDGIACCQRIQ